MKYRWYSKKKCWFAQRNNIIYRIYEDTDALPFYVIIKGFLREIDTRKSGIRFGSVEEAKRYCDRHSEKYENEPREAYSLGFDDEGIGKALQNMLQSMNLTEEMFWELYKFCLENSDKLDRLFLLKTKEDR